MRRVEVITIGEAQAIAKSVSEAVIYIDSISGKYIVEYYI